MDEEDVYEYLLQDGEEEVEPAFNDDEEPIIDLYPDELELSNEFDDLD